MWTRFDVVAAVAAGGLLGGLARYGAAAWFGTAPLVTFAVNVLGCVAIGALGALTVEAHAGHPLLRPFLGTGVLGGFTTFSGYTMDAQRLLASGRVLAASAYLGGTVVAALAAVQIGVILGRLARRGGR